MLPHGLQRNTPLRRHGVARAAARRHRVVGYDAAATASSSPAPTPAAYGYDGCARDLPRRWMLSSSAGRARRRPRWARIRSCASRSTSPSASPGSSSHARLRPRGSRTKHGCALRRARGGLRRAASRVSSRPTTSAAAGGVARVGREVRAPEHRAPRAPRRGRRRPASRAALEAFEDLHALERIECPAVVVASRDEADPGHPLALGETYAELLPQGRLVVEDEGKSPLAWQGGRLSKVIAELAPEAW